ncbi:hypothetical protein HCN44_011056 [Aphidius gifuensis]|uniref:Uncharacterized protein n=1 Tax=Aphidius gifuensis TaxID=684658 RepID=A0A834XYY1_APHGI|nr:hypothetical protein HCN44_011056 [Aphidius gifuensis]
MNKKLALIKWSKGKYDKTYSSEVPIEWIRGLNVDMYLNDNYANSQLYLVDWKNSKTHPPGGWEIGEAYVIYLSDKRKVLNNKLVLLNVVNSLLKLFSEVRDTNENTSYRNGNRLIKIGEQGSGVFVSDFQWATAASSLSFSDMATSFLMACFSLETLLHDSVPREFESIFSELAFKRAIRRKLCHLQRETEVSASDDDDTSF